MHTHWSNCHDPQRIILLHWRPTSSRICSHRWCPTHTRIAYRIHASNVSRTHENHHRLQHSNAAVVLATTKVFLHYTRHNPKVHQSVYARLKAPLMTLMTTSSELSYTVLGHVALLVARSPGTFNDEYKAFFCRYVCVRGGLCVGDGRG